MIDEHAQPAMLTAVEYENQTMQLGERGLVTFSAERAGNAEIAADFDVFELDVDLGQLRLRWFAMQAENQLIAVVADGVEVGIEVDGFMDSLLDIVGDFVKAKIVGPDQAALEELGLHVVLPHAPVIAAGT